MTSSAFSLPSVEGPVDRLFIVLGDQLDPSYVNSLGLRKADDAILMMEAADESRHVPSHIQRTTLFLSAMRHYAAEASGRGWRVRYVTLTDRYNTGSFGGEVERAARLLNPNRIDLIRPGEWRVLRSIQRAADEAGVTLELHEDPHFLCDLSDFNTWAEGRKELVLEYFYREQRKRHNVLLDNGNKPAGGAWNFDKENRKAFKRTPAPPPPPAFPPDQITERVIADVRRSLPDLPGEIENFNWPVTPPDAGRALDAFIEQRLPKFGDYQDAMWTGQSFLYHSALSPCFNLKLLDPRDAIERAVAAYESGRAPLNAVEGFVRQLLGWREFIRGVYWREGPGYADRNALEQKGSLPEFYWSGDTDMNCMKHALRSVLAHSFGHHIERLMVTGNFALIAGVSPRAISDWYLGMYADAVDWVTLPNTLGMAMHADGGVVGTKPYAASGKYIKRMSNYCEGCRYSLDKRSGEDACPFNLFYWDFLIRNEDRFSGNNRMAMILKHVEKMSREEKISIRVSATSKRKSLGIDTG